MSQDLCKTKRWVLSTGPICGDTEYSGACIVLFTNPEIIIDYTLTLRQYAMDTTRILYSWPQGAGRPRGALSVCLMVICPPLFACQNHIQPSQSHTKALLL